MSNTKKFSQIKPENYFSQEVLKYQVMANMINENAGLKSVKAAVKAVSKNNSKA